MEIAKLLKVELTYDTENEGIGLETVCTQLFKELVEDTETQIEVAKAVEKIEDAIEELIESISGKSVVTMNIEKVTSEVTGGIYRMPKE